MAKLLPPSTQLLSSLNSSSDYLAITVKIKGALPINLFHLYVPPIHSSSCDSCPKSFPPSSYHHPLPLIFLVILTAITHPGTFTARKTNQAKICLTGSFLISYLLTTLIITPYYTAPLENRSSSDLSLVPGQMASKCTWQTLPDLHSDNLSLTSAQTTLSPALPHLITIKPTGMITFLILIPTSLLPLVLQQFLFLKPPTPSPNSATMLPLLPFPSTASTALLNSHSHEILSENSHEYYQNCTLQ